jgi:hypothetical protein
MGKQYTSTGVVLTNTAGSNVVDSSGVVSITNFSSSGTQSLSTFTTTNGTYTPITNVTLNAVVERTTRTLIMASAHVYGDRSGAGDFEGETDIGIFINDTLVANGGEIKQRASTISGESVADMTTLTSYSFVNLSTGTNTISLKMKCVNLGIGNFKAAGNGFTLDYMFIGK